MPDIDKTTNVESSSIRKSCVRLSLFTAKKKYFPNFLTKQPRVKQRMQSLD